MRQLIYTSLLLIIRFRFTCGEKKNWKKHQKFSKYYDHGCSCPYWYATLNSCRYSKIETHLRNAQVNKAPSVNNRFAKICLVVYMVWKNWSRIVYCCLWIAVLLFSWIWFVLNCCEFSYRRIYFVHTSKNLYHGA